MRQSLCVIFALALTTSVAAVAEAGCHSRGASRGRSASYSTNYYQPRFTTPHAYTPAYATPVQAAPTVHSTFTQSTAAPPSTTTTATVASQQPAQAQPTAQSTDASDTTESVERQEIPVGVAMTFPGEKFPAGGIVLMKMGPVALRLKATTDSDGTATVQLPEVKLLRAADAELFILTKAGKVFETYAVTLMPEGK